MNLGDNGIALSLEAVAYDFANSLVKARSRISPDIMVDIPLGDIFATCLSTGPGQIALIDGRKKAEILLATKTWALVRPIDAEIPIVVETYQLSLAETAAHEAA